MRGVTKLSSDANKIKVGDSGSTIKLQLTNIEEIKVNALQHVRITEDYVSYVEVTDYQVADGNVLIRLPKVPRGSYYVEIMDTDGRIYPAEGNLIFEVVKSLEGGKQATFIDYKEEIVGELPGIVAEHMTTNAELYKGDKGDKGDTTVVPPKVFTRAEYDALPSKSADTLYIVKEVG